MQQKIKAIAKNNVRCTTYDDWLVKVVALIEHQKNDETDMQKR